mmetsp:Transcript_88632/g.228601  ORF Transcript_88632/g.228601 Transcript_88632/m.228601 type:complete len:204 (-) Transcript_88632:444-1055(-)
MSSVLISGNRSNNGFGIMWRRSHVEDAPMNHAESRPPTAAGSRQKLPSTANCSMDQSRVLAHARPQSLPAVGGSSPRPKASESTSSSATHLTAHLLRSSARSFSCRSSASRSSSPSLAKSFLKLFFCCRTCWFHSRSTSRCICCAAVLVGSTSSRSFNVAKHSSGLRMARCALALRYRAFTTCCGGNASLRQSALSTDLSAMS